MSLSPVAPAISDPTLSDRRGNRVSSVFGLLLLAGFGLAGCATPPKSSPPPASATGGDALVEKARQISARDGLLKAREFLTEELARRDDSKGAMENRLRRTAADKSLVFPDSLAALPARDRARIGMAFIPGMRAKQGHGVSKAVAALSDASEETARLGFQARLIPAVSRGDVDKNAAGMSEALSEVFAQSDHVILVAKSKGAHDLIYYLRHQGSDLPAAQRAKLKGVCILAGTVQGSFVANWFARNNDPWAAGNRVIMMLSGRGGQIGMLKSVADSPWIGASDQFPLDRFPNLTWVGLAVLPEGEDGRSSGAEWSTFFSEHIRKTSGWESPNDSLVETAAQVLPERVDVPQWIIRLRGTHAFPSGKFLDGSPFTPDTPPLADGMNPDSGSEIMNAFLRALPQSMLRAR